MNNIGTSIAALFTAAIGLAIVAVLVSKNANTAGVLQATGTGFGSIISAAVSPVTGGGSNSAGSQLSVPNFSNLFGGGSFVQ